MNKGFTLIEIMIVVMVISLLVLLVIPNLLRARIEANHTNAKATLNTIAKALESYANIHSVYPENTNLLLEDNPPYINANYFEGIHNGYTYTVEELTGYTYIIKATPEENKGTKIFYVKTGLELTEEEIKTKEKKGKGKGKK